MDHIPRSFNPVRLPTIVPRLSYTSYDGLDFESYPTRRGWDIARLLAGDFTERSDHETAAFLQDWLYFGTLATVLGDVPDKASYVQPDESSKYGRVATTRLPQDLQDRVTYVKAMAFDHPEHARSLVLAAEKCLQMLSYFCCMAECHIDGELDDLTTEETKAGNVIWPLPPSVDLSIRILGRLLTSSFYGALMTDFITGRLLPTSLPQLQFPPGKLLGCTMRRAGWCPSDVAMVSQEFSPSTLYYVSMMRREATNRDHSACTRQKCLAFQIDDATYVTKHVNDSCDCEFIGPPVADVVKTITGGGTPLMAISVDEQSGDVEVKVEPYKSGQEYVCFSHVWSDGLGNSNKNLLPKCQVRRLKGLLDELAGMTKNRDLLNRGRLTALVRKQRNLSPRFWLDTLCIPVQKEHKEVRSLAIRRMNQVYGKAYHLLVLDAELQKINVPDLRETLLQISICGWMRRLWTLLEGVVGARTHIKFHNQIIDLETVYARFGEHTNQMDMSRSLRQSQGSLESDAVKFYWKMALFRPTIRSSDVVERKILGYRVTYDTKFVQGKTESIKYDAKLDLDRHCHAVMEAFVASRWRTTSKREDVYLCLANLLGWDTQGLAKIPVDQRMRKLLEQQQDLPQGLIFVAGNHMTERGWRWAVTDFDSPEAVSINARIPFNDYTPAHRDARGLTVKYPGLILPATVTSIDTEELLVPTPDDAGTSQLKWWRIKVFKGEPISKSQKAKHPRLAVLFYDGRGNVATPYPGNVVMAAALVSIDSDGPTSAGASAQGVIMCTHLFLATIEVVGSVQEFIALRRRKDLDLRFLEDEAELVRSNWTVG